MFIQIYGVRSVEDALLCHRAGADAIGLCPPQFTGDDSRYPSVVSHETLVKILQETEKIQLRRILIVLGDDPRAAVTIAETYRPEMMQIASSSFTLTESLAKELRRCRPGIQLIQAVGVTGPESVDEAVRLSRWADLLLLDTVNPDPRHSGVGAAGVEHDRAIDRAIIEAVDIPVIIAGGLGPDNVEEAIRQTKPWGVDSLTRTNKILPDGTWCKDPAAVETFCRMARQAGKEIKQ